MNLYFASEISNQVSHVVSHIIMILISAISKMEYFLYIQRTAQITE